MAHKDKRFIYFIRCRELQAIKIGHSRNPRVRLMEFQTAHPYPLELLLAMPGDPDVEIDLHRQFEHLRLTGEWFHEDLELKCYIDEIKDNMLWFKVMTATPLEEYNVTDEYNFF
jgi:hypothetical protein